MPCKLCCLDRPLLNSHIIPEFLYKPVYDRKHRMAYGIGRGIQRHHLQKGLRQYLLCQQCEKRFSKWEHYGSQTLIHHQGIRVTQDENWTTIQNIDYTRFKLLLMSILWRTSVSSLHEFSQVTLGDTDDERLRYMLLNDDPGSPTDYGCSFLFLPDRGRHRHLHFPQTTIRGGLTTRWFAAPCLLFQYPSGDFSTVDEEDQHTLDYMLNSMVTVDGTLRFDQMPYADFVRGFTNWKDVLE